MPLSSKALTLLATWQDAATGVVQSVQGQGTLSFQDARNDYFDGKQPSEELS
jgi:hypothetical protein